MIRFGKIAYLNLLPFDVFLKRSNLPLVVKRGIAWHHGVPSAINAKFRSRRIDGAFISSIVSSGYRGTGAGIIARGEVRSVIAIPDTSGEDPASRTSNALSALLKISGGIMIGDAALRYALTGAPYTDLGTVWSQREGLPFVFARLCYHGNGVFYRRLAQRFTAVPVRIPRYILMEESRKRGIAPTAILEYLTLIDYTIDAPARRGLTRFLSRAKRR